MRQFSPVIDPKMLGVIKMSDSVEIISILTITGHSISLHGSKNFKASNRLQLKLFSIEKSNLCLSEQTANNGTMEKKC